MLIMNSSVYLNVLLFVLLVTAIDIDPGILGEVTFHSSDEHFSFETTDNKIGTLTVAQ